MGDHRGQCIFADSILGHSRHLLLQSSLGSLGCSLCHLHEHLRGVGRQQALEVVSEGVRVALADEATELLVVLRRQHPQERVQGHAAHQLRQDA